MTMMFMDNFSMYGTNKAFLLNGVYAEATQPFDTFQIIADPDGSGGKAAYFHVSAATVPTLRYVLQANQTTLGWCLRLWMNHLPNGGSDLPTIMDWRNAANTSMAHLSVETTGRLTWSDGTTTITTTNPVITANGWYHIEAKYKTSGTGSIEIRVEGLPVITDTDLGYAGHEPISQIASFYSNTNFADTVFYIKDYVIWNGAGTHNNDFLGAVIVYSMIPNADVDLNWVPTGAANGYSILDNSPPQDGVQFLTAINPPPDPYVGDMSDLPADVTSVKAIMTMVRAAKTDGGDANLQVGLISGTDIDNGADRPITVSQTYWYDISEEDPATAAPWLPSAANAAQLQINRTA